MTTMQIDRLREIAVDQHGLVTTDQAHSVGVPTIELVKLFSRGRLERPARGVYRVPFMPETELDQFQLAVLWTGDSEAHLSHETALELWELGDFVPKKIHVSISPARRIRRAGSDAYVLHREHLAPDEKAWVDGIPVVTPTKAIHQTIQAGLATATIEDALVALSRRTGVGTHAMDCLRSELASRDDSSR